MSLCRVKQQEMILKTSKFSVPAEMRRSTSSPDSRRQRVPSPIELQPPKKRDRRSLCGMSTVPAERLIQ